MTTNTTDASPTSPSPKNMLRLFIAIPLPDEIREQVAELSRNLQKGFQFTPCRPSWADPATMHLTLVFLGAKPAELVPDIARAVTQVAESFAPLRIEIKRLGVFPHWKSPRVLWAGIRERTHQIEDLHKALERRMTRFGYEPERKDFHPHLTLARFKSLKGTSLAEPIVNNHQAYKFGPFEAPEIILYQSELHPSGARHTPLHRAAFSAPAPASAPVASENAPPPSEGEQP